MKYPKTFFNKEIVPRWPDWEPTVPQMKDWVEVIGPYTEEDVLRVIKELVLRKSFKSPRLSDINKLLDSHGPAQSSFTRHLFVQRDNGVFHKIFIRSRQGISDELLMETGMREARKFGEMYQGRWIAYTGVTDWDMCRKRREIQSAIIDGRS